jgi:hypothetical protein
MKKYFLYLSVLIVGLFLTSCTKDCNKCEISDISHLKLYINEVHPTATPAWIEIYNPGSAAQSLKGCLVKDGASRTFVFPEGITIEGMSFLRLWFTDSSAALKSGFPLDPSGNSLALYDPNGLFIDQVIYPALPESQSYGRSMEGSESWSVFLYPTGGLPNSNQRNHPVNLYRLWMNPAVPLAGEETYITTEATDDHFVNKIELHCSYDGKDTVMYMTPFGCGTSFRGTLPALPAMTDVSFYITAEDDSLASSVFPASYPFDTFRFRVAAQ